MIFFYNLIDFNNYLTGTEYYTVSFPTLFGPLLFFPAKESGEEKEWGRKSKTLQLSIDPIIH